MNAPARPALKWGHPLLTPEGLEIRLPQFAFGKLRLLGLLQPNRNMGLFQISPRIDAFLHPDCRSLMTGLQQLLGPDLLEPDWLQCQCRSCQRLDEDADRTPKPRGKEATRRGRYWLKVMRARTAA